MSDSIKKFEEMQEEAKSYSGLGNWTETTTNNKIMTRNVDVKPSIDKESKFIFKNLLEDFREWNEHWKCYESNSDTIEKPMNADEFAEYLANIYEIESI